jgi:hypothetical protein
MDLLKYEFWKEEDDAYYHLIGQLVQKVRYYRGSVPIDEFKAAIPELKQIEKRLQDIDQSVGQETRFYLQEIMDELGVESEIEGKLIDEIQRSSKAIAHVLYDSDFAMDEFAFEFRNIEAVIWIEFYGYKEQKATDGTLLVVKEVFRSVCYKFGIIFIDSSLTDK